MKPELFTFDIFGTVLDWQTGLLGAVRHAGFPLAAAVDMDRVIDVQGVLEQQQYRTYREVTKDSLTKAFGMSGSKADLIAQGIGDWPLFPDSRPGLQALMAIAPCIAMTNSDFEHGEKIQTSLGFPFSGWICAEETRVYKPNPEFWHAVARKTGTSFGRNWWHVSAYADYDLAVARELGLTCVYIPRPHSRPGFFHVQAADLVQLARLKTGL